MNQKRPRVHLCGVLLSTSSCLTHPDYIIALTFTSRLTSFFRGNAQSSVVRFFSKSPTFPLGNSFQNSPRQIDKFPSLRGHEIAYTN
jgi:hypothetical protein